MLSFKGIVSAIEPGSCYRDHNQVRCQFGLTVRDANGSTVELTAELVNPSTELLSAIAEQMNKKVVLTLKTEEDGADTPWVTMGD